MNGGVTIPRDPISRSAQESAAAVLAAVAFTPVQAHPKVRAVHGLAVSCPLLSGIPIFAGPLILGEPAPCPCRPGACRPRGRLRSFNSEVPAASAQSKSTDSASGTCCVRLFLPGLPAALNEQRPRWKGTHCFPRTAPGWGSHSPRPPAAGHQRG